MPNRNGHTGEAHSPAPLSLRLSAWAMDVACSLIGIFMILYTALVSIHLIRLPVTKGTITAAAGLWTVLLLIAVARRTRRHFVRTLLLAILPALALAALSVMVNGHVYDTSFDGQAYHELAVVRLAEGWNPLVSYAFPESLWVMHYPRALWSAGAVIYLFTDAVDTGKAGNLIFLFASFFAAFGALIRFYAAWADKRRAATGKPSGSAGPAVLASAVLSVAVAFNPIALVQLFTFYNDGVVGSLLLFLLAALAYYVLAQRPAALASAAAVAAVLINVKFTAVAYAGLFCAFLLVYLAAAALRHSSSGAQHVKPLRRIWAYKPFRHAFLTLFGAGVVGLLVFGFSPYVTNTVHAGHPLYPLAGPNKIDIMTENSPADFIGKDRFRTFLKSYTSKTDDPVQPHVSQRAPLWPIDKTGFDKINVDTRTAGFGPLSLWILIGSAALGLLLLAADWRLGVPVIVFAAALLVTVFINPEPWWARYVPQLWFVPAVLAAGAIASKRRLLQAAALLLVFVLLYNQYGVSRAIFSAQLEQSREVRQQLHELAKAGRPLTIFTFGFTSIPVHLKEHGIPFTSVSQEQLCSKPQPFALTPGTYCES